MQTRIVERITDVAAADWDRLAGDANPFVRHAFLAALERHDCVGEGFGWWPRHVLVHDGGRLVAAAPLYLKDNSYGELVFDWSWAEAYERARLPYYPKLVSAVPYTPATGPRLLTAPDGDGAALSGALLDAALEHCRSESASSLHWLFPTGAETDRLVSHGLLRRTGCQYHWHNAGYRDFQDFLDRLTSKRRKQIRKERRDARRDGVDFEIRRGAEIEESHWALYARLYRATFDRKWGVATLNEGFFREIGETLGDAVMLILARQHGEYFAGALALQGRDTLFGRHWGCSRQLPGVHFEVCYYQTIEYCIGHGLARFEAGAQGEHKISRGFEPVPTWSAHWIAHPDFRRAIADFVEREARAMEGYMRDLGDHLPYRQEPGSVALDDPVSLS